MWRDSEEKRRKETRSTWGAWRRRPSSRTRPSRPWSSDSRRISVVVSSPKWTSDGVLNSHGPHFVVRAVDRPNSPTPSPPSSKFNATPNRFGHHLGTWSSTSRRFVHSLETLGRVQHIRFGPDRSAAVARAAPACELSRSSTVSRLVCPLCCTTHIGRFCPIESWRRT